MKHVTKPALILFLIAAIVTSLLSLVHAVTLEPIAEQAKRTQEKTMREVLPQATEFGELSIRSPENVVAAFAGRADGERIGYVIELAPEGYSGKINMMVGISTVDNVITGMRVLKHTETPGLGALATKEKFYSQYDNRPLSPITVVKAGAREGEIDAMTSATITTKAITDAVNEAIEFVKVLEENAGSNNVIQSEEGQDIKEMIGGEGK